MAPRKKPPRVRLRHYLKEWRKEKGNPSQEKVADAIGVDRTTLSKIERGEVPYSQDNLEALAEYYRVHPADLLRDPHQELPTIQVNSIDEKRLLKGMTVTYRSFSVRDPAALARRILALSKGPLPVAREEDPHLAEILRVLQQVGQPIHER